MSKPTDKLKEELSGIHEQLTNSKKDSESNRYFGLAGAITGIAFAWHFQKGFLGYVFFTLGGMTAGVLIGNIYNAITGNPLEEKEKENTDDE